MSSGYVAVIVAIIYFVMFLVVIGIAASAIIKGNMFAVIILLFSPLFFLPAFYAYEYNKKDNLKEEKKRLETEYANLKKENERAKKEYWEIKGKIESYGETEKMLGNIKKNIEELSEKVGRKRYECTLCGTVFFSDSSESENLICPKCRSEFVADTAEQKGTAFEMWCATGYQKEGGIFRMKDGEWILKRGPLSRQEYIERFYKRDLPEKDLPDFQFFYRHPSKKWEVMFQIECKWRHAFKAKKLEIDNLKKYEKFDNEKDGRVFLLIGVLGYPLNPKRVFVVPYNKISEKERTGGYITIDTLEREGKERKNPDSVLNVTKNGDDVEMYWIKRPESKAR